VVQEEISVLIAGDRYLYCGEVENLLRHTRWRVYTAHTVEEAKKALKRYPIEVVLCQHTLRDGTWVDVLNATSQCDPPSALVVLSSPDDRIWAEVLSRGAYDLLPVPCNASELYAIVPMAWRHCIQQEHASAVAV
jgi:DNA-binding NtrC family response regulator